MSGIDWHDPVTRAVADAARCAFDELGLDAIRRMSWFPSRGGRTVVPHVHASRGLTALERLTLPTPNNTSEVRDD